MLAVAAEDVEDRLSGCPLLRRPSQGRRVPQGNRVGAAAPPILERPIVRVEGPGTLSKHASIRPTRHLSTLPYSLAMTCGPRGSMLFGSPPSCSRCDTAASGIGVIVTLDFTFTTTTLVVVFTCDVWSREQPFNAVSRFDANRRIRHTHPADGTPRGTERARSRGARQSYRRTVNSTAN